MLKTHKKSCKNSYIILSEKENCKIVKCKKCSSFHFTFNKVFLDLTYEDLTAFREIIDAYEPTWPFIKNNIGKNLVIKSQVTSNVYFGFTNSEWFTLKELFEEAVRVNDFFKKDRIFTN